MRRLAWLAAPLLLVLQTTQGRGPSGVDVGRWTKLDRESRWLIYRNSGNNEAQRKKLWVKWLAQRNEWDLLEWIVIYDGYSVAGPALELHDPRWIRCAVFSANHPDSHTMSEAKKALQERSPALVLSWLEAHPKAVTPALTKILKKLREGKHKRVDVSRYPGPIDVAALLRPLDDPRRPLQTLEVGQPAKPGTLYAHQVERSLDALVNSGFRTLKWQRKVFGWAQHHDPVLRRTALLALTKLQPSRQLLGPLLSIVKSADDPEDVRVALLAASYIHHPELWLFLHHVAKSPRHPGFRVAVSRLAGTGNGFTLEHLRDLPSRAGLGPADSEFVVKQLDRLTKRVGAIDLGKNPELVRTMLVTAAWAEVADDPLAARLQEWTTKRIQRDLGNAKVQRAVAGLSAYKAEVGDDTQRTRMTELVRELTTKLRAR